MIFFKHLTEHWRHMLATNFPAAVLKIAIIAWCIMVILLTLLIDNVYALAGIFLYEVLP